MTLNDDGVSVGVVVWVTRPLQWRADEKSLLKELRHSVLIFLRKWLNDVSFIFIQEPN